MKKISGKRKIPIIPIYFILKHLKHLNNYRPINLPKNIIHVRLKVVDNNTIVSINIVSSNHRLKRRIGEMKKGWKNEDTTNWRRECYPSMPPGGEDRRGRQSEWAITRRNYVHYTWKRDSRLGSGSCTVGKGCGNTL